MNDKDQSRGFLIQGFRDRWERISFQGVTLYKKNISWSSHWSSVVMNPISTHEVASSIPGLAQWVEDPVWP